MLAAARQAGRLHIDPILISLGGEGLPEAEYGRISAAVGGATIFNLYACNEAVALSFTCREDWLHIHEDWIVFEPVKAHYTPTLPGQLSHTVLLSTLYKGEQPILRYDLGDRVLRRSDPCPCGSPFMAIRLQGRSAEVLTFTTDDAEPVAIVPLAFTTTVERTTGVELFQLVQTNPGTLQIRLRTAEGTDPRQVPRSRPRRPRQAPVRPSTDPRRHCQISVLNIYEPLAFDDPEDLSPVVTACTGGNAAARRRMWRRAPTPARPTRWSCTRALP